MHNFVLLILLNMKRFFQLLIIAISLGIMVGCDALFSSNSAKREAIGSPYELVVLCDEQNWKGALGEELRYWLEQPIEMLNQEEPRFNVVHTTPQFYKQSYPFHRNILKVACSPEAKMPVALAEYDKDAAPQIVVTFQGPSVEAMVEYLKENGDKLCKVFEMAERDRTMSAAEKHGAKDLEKVIRQKFGIEMHLSTGYAFRTQSDNFLWASYEFPLASQGFFLYSHDFNGKQSITTNALVKARNKFAKRIPGPSEHSYMTTVTRIPSIEKEGEYINFEPERKVVRINGVDWIELRGFWEVEGDFMGGPFVSYTTLDRSTGKLLTLDCYVYSPKDGKRNFLRALESLVYGVKFTNQQ